MPVSPFGPVPLTPTAFLDRARIVHADRTALVDGELRRTYAELADRCERLAGALAGLGGAPGDRVSVLAPNVGVALEAHFGVPWAGAVLNALNTRLSAGELAYVVEHAGAKVLLVDTDLADLGRSVAAALPGDIRLVVAGGPDDELEALLAAAMPLRVPCEDELSLLALNYTSGTTGRPKGVMYSHRGAYLQALAMAAQTRGMPVPVGGAGVLAAALVAVAEEAGVVVRTGMEVTRVVVRGGRAVGVVTADGEGITARRAVVADVAPHLLARDLVGEQHLPAAWLASLRRHRWTSGYFRLDVDLDGPAPWRDERLADSTVVHVSGDLDEMAMSQAQVRRGRLPDLPQLILGQQDRADPSRVPPGAAGLWVECHCPARPVDEPDDWAQPFAERVLDRLEQHAPGLRSRIVVDDGLLHAVDLDAHRGDAVVLPGGPNEADREVRAGGVEGLGAAVRLQCRADDARRQDDRHRGAAVVQRPQRRPARGAAAQVRPQRRQVGPAGEPVRALTARGDQPFGASSRAASSKCIGSVYLQSPPQRKPHRLKIFTTSGFMVPRMPR